MTEMSFMQLANVIGHWYGTKIESAATELEIELDQRGRIFRVLCNSKSETLILTEICLPSRESESLLAEAETSALLRRINGDATAMQDWHFVSMQMDQCWFEKISMVGILLWNCLPSRHFQEPISLSICCWQRRRCHLRGGKAKSARLAVLSDPPISLLDLPVPDPSEWSQLAVCTVTRWACLRARRPRRYRQAEGDRRSTVDL